MITNIDTTLKNQMINNRLQNLTRQHFEAKLDIIQAEANGRVEDVERYKEYLLQLEKSYIAIEALLNN